MQASRNLRPRLIRSFLILLTLAEQNASSVFMRNIELRRRPHFMYFKTLWDTNREDLKLDEQDMNYGKAIFARDMAVVLQMKRAGVPILAGTDGPYSEGGKALHEELALLVQAGLTPLEALQSATRNAADFMGSSKPPVPSNQGKRLTWCF